MKIYKIETNDHGYDTFDGFVVIANSEEEAKEIALERSSRRTHLCKPIEIGNANAKQRAGLVLASFNAG